MLYAVGTIMVSKYKVSGITRGDWVITAAVENAATGNMYTLRALSMNTEINTVNQWDMDHSYQPLNKSRRRR